MKEPKINWKKNTGKLNIAIATPLWPPLTGGAATYYPLLTRELLADSRVGQIHLMTEKFDGKSAESRIRLAIKADYRGRLFMHECLPPRIARPERPSVVHHSWLYFLQNLAYLKWPLMMKRHQIDVLVLHSGFFIAPGLLQILFSSWRRDPSRLLVADVRDTRSPSSRLTFCDVRFFCSYICKAHYSKIIGAHDAIVPVPFEKPAQVVSLNSLQDSNTSPVIVYVGMIREIKNVDKLIKAFTSLRKHRHPDATLRLAGHMRESKGSELSKLIELSPGVSYLGELARSEVAVLMGQADLVVSPSMHETLSRVCLEAIALGTKVLCPNNIPEYVNAIPQWTINGDDVAELEVKMNWALEQKEAPQLNLSSFDPERVAELFVDKIIEHAEYKRNGSSI